MKQSKWLWRALLAVLILGALITGGILLRRSIQLHRTQAKTEQARELIEQPETPEPEEPEEALPPQEETLPKASETMHAPEEAPEEEPAEEPEPPEETPEPEPLVLLEKYDALAHTYYNFAGWLTIGDKIDTIVMRGADNEFYLDHDFTGEEAWGGAIFMDCYNWLEPLSRNTILYGHHLADNFDNQMFGRLMEYKKESYAREYPTFYFSSPYQEYECTIFASYNIYPDDWRLYSVEFTDDEDFLAYCNDAIALSKIDYGVTVQPDDKIITLSTCDYVYEDSRFIIHAVVRPLNESN